MVIRITYPNLLHGTDFLCFLFMNYYWTWESNLKTALRKSNCVSCAGHDLPRFTLLHVFSLLYDWLTSFLGFCFDSVVSNKLYKEITSVLILQRSFSKKKQKAKQTNKNAHELTYWNNEARLWRTKKAWSGLSAQKWWRNAITFVTIAANSLLWRQPAWGKNKREYQVIHFTNASVLNAKKSSWGLRHQSEEH